MFFACFRPYVWQPDDHICWATLMPFAGLIMLNFAKILRIDGFQKRSFFWVGHFGFFFSKKKNSKSNEKQSKVLGEQGWVEDFMFTLVSSPWGLGPTLMHRTVIGTGTTARSCSEHTYWQSMYLISLAMALTMLLQCDIGIGAAASNKSYICIALYCVWFSHCKYANSCTFSPPCLNEQESSIISFSYFLKIGVS